MKTVNVHEAKTHLSALLVEVSQGEDVTIARNGKPVARLVAIQSDRPREPGRFRGKIAFLENPVAPVDETEVDAWISGHSADPLSSKSEKG